MHIQKHKIAVVGTAIAAIAILTGLSSYRNPTRGNTYKTIKRTMDRKLFLCSSFADVATLFPTFAGEDMKGKSVAFIPTASIHEEYRQYVEDGRRTLSGYGLKIVDLEISQMPEKEIAHALEECDYIYVSGGNTFFLLQELRKKKADQLIIREIEKGKTYIGESAGTMIMAPDIKYAKEMDNHLSLTPGFCDFTALGLINFYPVVHYNSFPFERETKNIIRKYTDLELVPISNEQAIEVIGESIKVETK
jgi:dipeptidase E